MGCKCIINSDFFLLWRNSYVCKKVYFMVQLIDGCLFPDSGDYLLASGSKDSTVRLWRLSTAVSKNQMPTDSETEDQELQVKSTTFSVPSDVRECQMCVRLEAVLAGHEGQVSEVSWAQPVMRGIKHNYVNIFDIEVVYVSCNFIIDNSRKHHLRHQDNYHISQTSVPLY